MEGLIEKVDPILSDDYFASRPRMSQIGAWASEQSKEIPDRATLDERVKFFEEKYPDVVKVYTVGDPEADWYSREICGGPHVSHTGELGTFRITKEESSSAGVRRIKAVLE